MKYDPMGWYTRVGGEPSCSEVPSKPTIVSLRAVAFFDRTVLLDGIPIHARLRIVEIYTNDNSET